uniref:Protein kinase domain-containing protein n=1 Tax=Caenorhabditis japonica TaxID=281687 RepID=A0A8R1HVE0_CAEJA
MVSATNENRRIKQKVEVLARSCQQYEQLVEKLGKSSKLDNFDILYDVGKYQMVVDGQKTLDEAIKHNGRKLVVEFLLQKGEDDAVNDWVTNGKFLPVPMATEEDRVNGTFYGKSYGLPSQASRYSEKALRYPGRYKIGKKLGEGTLGAVYIAEGKKGGTFAVKIIPKHGRHLPQEADVDYLKMLRHERIVEYMFIIEPSSTNDIHVLMEYMPTGSLKEYIDRMSPLHHKLVKSYTKQILEGLDFLHSKNIIHQDLKPANLLLKNTHRENAIKIADFGSSRFATLKKNRAGLQGGTPKYTDPGVSIGREVAGRRSDIWSLGVIVIEMYTGVYPWNIDGEHAITVPRVLEEHPPSIRLPASEKLDDDLVGMAKMMLLPGRERPYASTLLELPVLEESAPDDDDDDEDSDFF